jgi:hypothetical protein
MILSSLSCVCVGETDKETWTSTVGGPRAILGPVLTYPLGLVPSLWLYVRSRMLARNTHLVKPLARWVDSKLS